MNRKGFGRVLAALGVGAVAGLGLTPLVAHVELSPPAPPIPVGKWVTVEELWGEEEYVRWVYDVEVYRAPRDTALPKKYVRWFVK